MSIKISDEIKFIQGQEKLFKSQSKYLETLVLKDGASASTAKSQLTLPVLKNLETLVLDKNGRVCTGERDRFLKIKPIEAKKVPQLKSVTIYADVLSISNKIFAASSAFKSVREIHVKHWNKYNGFDIVEQVSRKIPNLNKLKGSCCNLDSTAVTVFFGGFPRDHDWTAFKQTHEGFRTSAVVPIIDPPGISLRNMKGITSLELNFHGDCNCIIDEMAVRMIFLRLSRDLHITMNGNFSISTELAAELTEYYKNLSLTPSKRYEDEIMDACDTDQDSSDSISDSDAPAPRDSEDSDAESSPDDDSIPDLQSKSKSNSISNPDSDSDTEPVPDLV